jgi:Bax protein
LVAFLVGGLLTAGLFDPPNSVTAGPRVVMPLPVSAPIDPAPSPLATPVKGQETVGTLSSPLPSLGYDLEPILAGDGRVPRIFLASFPPDLAQIREVAVRKAIFFKTVLPLILQVNEEILADRRRLWRLKSQLRMGEQLGALDRLWLSVVAERYGVERGDLNGLLERVDVIPPSLALAQSAEESGWGTSRFVREGNALFGQWVFARDGHLTPRARDSGKTHKVKAFDNLIDSVRAYAENLNSHRAYGTFRRTRAAMRRERQPLDGAVLAETLTRYSERRWAYVRSIRTIIAVNGLSTLDGARLHDQGQTTEPLI